MEPSLASPPNATPQEHEILARLDARKVSVSLSTRHICCLYAIMAWLQKNGEASIAHEELREVIFRVLAVIEQDGELPEKRVTHTLDDLRQGQLLIRSDMVGLNSSGRWMLSPLAKHVVDFFVQELTLDEQSLVITTTTIRGLLREIEGEARQGGDAAWWRAKVSQPLDLVVSELVQSIDRRRRGLDLRQEQVRTMIRQHLELRWEEGIESVESLLSTTADTIDELHAVVLRELDALDNALGGIGDLAEQACATEAIQAVQRLSDQLFQLRAWSTDRHAAWSDWYQRVQRNTRELLRLDPNRRISERLRKHLQSWDTASWALVVPAPVRHRPLRRVAQIIAQAPVTGAPPTSAGPVVQEVDEEVERRLQERLRALLAEHGSLRLRQALESVLPEPALGEPYGAIGVIAHHMVNVGRLPAARGEVTPWVALPEGVEIQDIQVLQTKPRST